MSECEIEPGVSAVMRDKAKIVLEAIASRRSMGLSKLKPDPVDPDLIQLLLDAANWGPSHEDTEPWRFTVFSGEGRNALADIFADAHSKSSANPDAEGARKRAFAAPVWIAIGVCPRTKKDGSLLMREEEEVMAVACAIQNLHLMASALGIAGMWHSKGLSVDPVVAERLGLRPPCRLLGFFMAGLPSGEWTSGERGPIAEKVRWVTGESSEDLGVQLTNSQI